MSAIAVEVVVDLTWPALAKALGISRQTLFVWRKKFDSPRTADLKRWIAYRDRMSEHNNKVPHSAEDAGDGDDAGEFRRLRLKLLEAQTGKESAVRKLRELELQRVSLELVPMGDAREVLRSKIEPLRQLLEALPTAAAALANPQNPHVAEKALQVHVEKILRVLSEQGT
jgi:hypothetical protein